MVGLFVVVVLALLAGTLSCANKLTLYLALQVLGMSVDSVFPHLAMDPVTADLYLTHVKLHFPCSQMQVLGVSVDSVFSHLAWIQTPRAKGGLGGLSYPLLAGEQLCLQLRLKFLLLASHARSAAAC